jgi:amino acid adenylation domain-containing protein
MSGDLQNAVAIIGMAGRFPGAENVEQFWENLCQGRESISAIPAADLEDRLTPEQRSQGKYVAARALLHDVDRFDAEFFHFLPREAELTDPQQRVLIECAWNAFEDAGYDPAAIAGNVGVFAGASVNTYLLLHLASDPKFREEFARSYQVGSFPALVGNGHDFLATRISYKLNLRGPAMTVQSACSTSLLAVAQAWQSLVNFQCDLALAGGVSISFPQRRGYFYQEGGMVSLDGHCRPFDKAASGTVFGAGAGMVLLKRATEAIADGDHIYALVLGAGVNNDGSDKIGYAAPSSKGQTDAIATAYAVAGVDPVSIGYVECHGTGTPLGDPIEVAALAEAFSSGGARESKCLISSVKGNVGHLDVAAGVTGLMKVALALDREKIPGTLHFAGPNERLELGKTPFSVTGNLTEWPRLASGADGIRRAGVSAFGVGGTNVHLVLEEAPEISAKTNVRATQLLCVSARSEAALDAQCQRLAAYLEKPDASDISVADAAYTLATGRRHFKHRLAITAANRDEAVRQLRKPQDIRNRHIASETAGRIAMLFPGQGTQYPGMGEGLYRTEPFYRQIVEDCCGKLQSLTGLDLLPILYPQCGQSPGPAAREEAAQVLEQTRYAQPALFVTSYALARLWMVWGVLPAILVGHSVGELVAACLAGVFSLDDALVLVARRGEWMQEMPPGSMLAVRMQPTELQMLLPHSLSIAAINGPSLAVVSGPAAEIETLRAQFERDKIVCRRLRTSHAFHSFMVDPVIGPLRQLVEKFALHAPKLPILSTVTGEVLKDEEATSAEYWARHCRVPVNFSGAATALIRDGLEIFLEAGAGETLTTLVRQHLPRGSKALACSSLPASMPGDDASPGADWATLAASAGNLWTRGVPLDWRAYYASENCRRVPLPTYPFERKRYWVEGATESKSSPIAGTGIEIPAVIAPPGGAADLPIASDPLEKMMNSVSDLPIAGSAGEARQARFSREVAALLEDLSGLELTADQYESSFLELSFDSLFLTQAAQKLQVSYGIKIAFRQLLDDLNSISRVAAYLDAQLPSDAPTTVIPAVATPVSVAALPVQAPIATGPSSSQITGLVQQQLLAMAQLIQNQLQILGLAGSEIPSNAPAGPAVVVAPPAPIQPASRPAAAADEHILHKKPIQASHAVMGPDQERFLAALVNRYCRKTAGSKAFTQQHRKTLADPRVVSGFRPEWKEIVYSIVSDRSKGSKLWDIDGNEYIDLLNGFGPTMFGHAPDFVTRAVERQLEQGFAIGPQTSLAGKAADLLTQLTGAERVTFCNTGSEAVMAAMRIARTVTGRDRVVFFAGDYHGQFDEVLAKQLKRKGEISAQSAAPGIPRANLGNVTVLDYGTDESLRWIEQHAQELAAVLIEPVQSRHPDLQPKEFLLRVREITRQSGTAFVFDEVVTGFRIHPRGAQGFYGIDADMLTYGKVVGGGMPIGVLAGKAAFMDALDGGQWQFGDRSVPEAGVTFFAGTFVRHPLTMAALCATLEHIRDSGEALYESLNKKASDFVARINEAFSSCGAHLHLNHCGSVMFFSIPPDERFGGLLFYLLREKGVFLLEGFPLYLTTEHSDADLKRVVAAFRESVMEMQSCGLLARDGAASPRSDSAQQTVTVTEVTLTEPQLEIMLAAQVSDQANCAFNESFRVELEGGLDAKALATAWTSLLDRHDALRMSPVPAGDRMRVDRDRKIGIDTVELSGRSESAQQQSLNELIANEGNRPFDLAIGPLVRARLVTLAAERQVLLVTAHHLICDGWSVNVLIDELGQLYSATLRGTNAELPAALQFSRYAVDAQKEDQREHRTRDIDYWRTKLTPQPELMTLPSDRNRPPQRSYAGSTYFVDFPRELALALRKTGASAGCTLFTTLLAGWQILLWRLSGNNDPVVMIPAAAQSQIEDKVLVGHCVHLLPIRAAIDPVASAKDYLRAMKPTVLDAYDHQNATYGSIVRELAPTREAGRLPFSEIQFNLEQIGRAASFQGLKADVRANGKKAVNFDLFLNIVDTGNGLRLECDYNTGVYEESTIARWLENYRALLEGIVANPAQSVEALPVLPDPMRRYLLETCNATATGPLAIENVPALIDATFSSMPSQTAAEFYGLTLTRAELAAQSDGLAAWLIRHGAGPGALVGIYMDRSLEMLIAMLGVMKAGAAYVPLDPMFPASRIEQILEETEVAVMLTLARHMEDLPGSNARVLALDTEASALANEGRVALPQISAHERAYVIFTSGSSGRPKGVEVTHGSVVNLLNDLTHRLDMKPSDRLLAVTTISFDIAVLELLLPLVCGGTVAIAHRDDVADGLQLMELLRATRATVLQATPVTWRMLIEQGFEAPQDFKMLCGGEAWTTAMADQLIGDQSSGGRVWNMYGPTETTVWSSVTEVTRGAARMTIGPPIANTRFYVLDARLQPVPPGVPGELFIAGAGVARSYFHRPDLTAEKFLPDPFVHGERMYRTGDEVCQFADGRIEFLGRMDQQIKLRGFRIELGEIEVALRGIPGVRDAVVVLRRDDRGDAILAAYYTGEAEATPAAVRQVLRTQLPMYMVPSVLQQLASLPLTPNGKIDRRALPDIGPIAPAAQEEFVEPTTRNETILADIFCEVLGCSQISIRTSLLDAGADSLRMFQIASRAHRRGLAVTVRQLMQLHTVEAVAAALGPDQNAEAEVVLQSTAIPLRRVARESYRIGT